MIVTVRPLKKRFWRIKGEFWYKGRREEGSRRESFVDPADVLHPNTAAAACLLNPFDLFFLVVHDIELFADRVKAMTENPCELAPICGGSTVSEVLGENRVYPFMCAGCGSFDGCGNYYRLHPIYKGDEGGTTEHCDNVALRQFPRRQRSKTKARRKNGATVQDSGKMRKLGSKHKAESTDSEVSCEYSPRYRRQSGRVCRGVTPGKLDSSQFELHLEKVWGRFPEEKTDGFAHLDSLWFSLYRETRLKAKVLSWIKSKAIFSKKYVFIPIVLWRHWFLLIFCHFGETPHSNTGKRCMLLLDSLRSANTQQLKPGIRSFVVDIFRTEERREEEELIRNIPLFIPKVPQQKNNDECGFFVLYYINLFLERVPENASVSMGYPDFMKENWFNSHEIERFVKGLH